MNISLSTLANRFRNFNFNEETPDSFNVMYVNNNSRGNRYVSWHGIWAKPEAGDDDNVIGIDRLYQEVNGSACEWGHLFEGVHYGLIVGPRVLTAVEQCLDILRNDVSPNDDGAKVRYVNRLGGVNYVTKSWLHDQDLTTRLGQILSTAFFADRQDKLLYSEKFAYIYKSHSGWSRSC